MRKILIVATVVKTHIMQFDIPLMRELKKQGWYVCVAAKNDYDNPDDCVIPFCDEYHDVDFVRNPISSKNISAYFSLKKIIDEGHFDIVHCNTPVGGALTRLAARQARKNGTKVVYTAHGLHFYKGASFTNWLLFYPAEKMCSRWTDAFIAINEEDYNLACNRFYAKKCIYIPGVGIDLDKYSRDIISSEERLKFRHRLGVADNEKIVISVGELISRKNYEIALGAIALLEDEPVKYLICGSGELKEHLRDVAENLGIRDKVVFLGYRYDVNRILASSDIFLTTSQQEGLPVAVIEAMATGIPIICSNIRGCRDLSQDNDTIMLCDVNNCEDYAYWIRYFLNKSEDKIEYRVERYSDKNIATDTINLYEELMG